MKKNERCVEVVVSRARSGVQRGEVLKLSAKLQAWAVRQPGFVARRLMLDERQETWVDWVEWESEEAARAAAAACAHEPFAAEMERVLDLASMTMLHTHET